MSFLAAGTGTRSKPRSRAPPARHRKRLPLAVKLVYRHFWGRDADPEAIRYFTTAMREGMSFFRLAQELEASPEAEHRRQDIEKGYPVAVDSFTGIFWDAMPTPKAFGILRLP